MIQVDVVGGYSEKNGCRRAPRIPRRDENGLGKKRKRKNLELSGPQNRVFTLISGRAAFLGCAVVRRRRLFEAILNTPCGW